ncbi:hypothetical protein BOTBODRAFT_78865, partial [Botryobasidium botryosum FD-172 SS1]
PNWFFQGNEFAWGDSAYTLLPRMIPIHKKPANLVRENAIFDHTVAAIRVRSEHTMGALKGQWQALCGLRVLINSNNNHINACRWITVCIILHNLL